MPRQLGAVLRTARESRDLTVSELSTRSGVSRAMIDEIERGKNVSVDTLAKIARSLGIEHLPIGDVTVYINDAMASYIRSVASRIAKDASELFDRVQGEQAKPRLEIADRPTGEILPFWDRRVRITFAEEQQVEQLRRAFANSEDAEFRTAFRGKKKYVVPRGIDAAAGHGAELLTPNEEEEQLREIPEHYWEQLGARMVLRARGNSLIGRGIVDRDLLFIRPTVTPENDLIVVCRLNNFAYVKIFEKRGSRIRLLSANPKFGPIDVEPSDSFHCFGIVVGRSGYGLQRTEEIK